MNESKTPAQSYSDDPLEIDLFPRWPLDNRTSIPRRKPLTMHGFNRDTGGGAWRPRTFAKAGVPSSLSAIGLRWHVCVIRNVSARTQITLS